MLDDSKMEPATVGEIMLTRETIEDLFAILEIDRLGLSDQREDSMGLAVTDRDRRIRSIDEKIGMLDRARASLLRTKEMVHSFEILSVREIAAAQEVIARTYGALKSVKD